MKAQISESDRFASYLLCNLHPQTLDPEAPTEALTPKRVKLYIVEARKLEHHYPHGLKVNYKGS